MTPPVLTGAGDAEALPPRYPYVVIDVSTAEAEEAGALLFELGALGVEERDATTMAKPQGAQVTLVASFDAFESAREAADALPRGWAPRLDEVVGDAWRDEWKKHFEPFRLCGAIVVRPPWRSYEASTNERVIVLEPGRAFGTGLHETTRLVAEVLADFGDRLQGSEVLDVGCGSGVLSLAALALGARHVRAVDIDPDAVLVTRENAERNGLADRVHADTTAAEALSGAYPFVVANIEAMPLVALAPALLRLVASGGRLVLSGILAPDVSPAQWPSVERAYAPLETEEVRCKGEWIAAVLKA